MDDGIDLRLIIMVHRRLNNRIFRHINRADGRSERKRGEEDERQKSVEAGDENAAPSMIPADTNRRPYLFTFTLAKIKPIKKAPPVPVAFKSE